MREDLLPEKGLSCWLRRVEGVTDGDDTLGIEVLLADLLYGDGDLTIAGDFTFGIEDTRLRVVGVKGDFAVRADIFLRGEVEDSFEDDFNVVDNLEVVDCLC